MTMFQRPEFTSMAEINLSHFGSMGLKDQHFSRRDPIRSFLIGGCFKIISTILVYSERWVNLAKSSCS